MPRDPFGYSKLLERWTARNRREAAADDVVQIVLADRDCTCASFPLGWRGSRSRSRLSPRAKDRHVRDGRLEQDGVVTEETHDAVRRGDIGELRRLLEAGRDVDEVDIV